jgi:hypothetical protein
MGGEVPAARVKKLAGGVMLRAADLLEATAPPGTRKLVAGSALSQRIDDGNTGGGPQASRLRRGTAHG